MDNLVIGSRSSDLAIAQSNLCIQKIQKLHPHIHCSIEHIKNSGDKAQGTPAASKMDKKAWIDGLEQAILSGTVQLAIHSGKDLPVDYAEGTKITSVLPRANPFDCFIGKPSADGARLSVEQLPENCVIGTASLRRGSQMLRKFPKATIVEHRGNVPTRIKKLEDSDTLSGIILAAAGIQRLQESVDFEQFDVATMMPAVHQGTLVAQYSVDDERVEQIVSELIDATTQTCFVAERACIEKLNASCKSALGVYATLENDVVLLRARVLSPDGREVIEEELSGKAPQADELGNSLAEALLSQGARDLLG